MFTYDEIIKIIWFISLIIDLLIYKKFYEENIIGPLKIFLNSLQVILGICFFIPIAELVISWYGFWECWISGILLFCFCFLQKFMFLQNKYSKNLKIIDKIFLLIIFSIIIFFATIKKESRKLDWFYLLLNYGNISFYIGWLVL